MGRDDGQTALSAERERSQRGRRMLIGFWNDAVTVAESADGGLVDIASASNSCVRVASTTLGDDPILKWNRNNHKNLLIKKRPAEGRTQSEQERSRSEKWNEVRSRR